MRAARIVFLILFFALSALPLADKFLGFIPPVALVGVTTAPPAVEANLKTYWKGEFQPAFEANFNEGLAIRGYFVRADNELNLRAFSALGLDPHASQIIGKDNYVFERGYVDAFNRHDEVPSSEMEPKVERLALLQRYLESRGATLLVVITPSKPLLYPEYLPKRYVFKERQNVPTNYEKFVPLLAKHGVHFVDGQALLTELKPKVPFTLFSSSSTHWNDPAACEVSSVAIATLGQQLGLELPRLRCAPYLPDEKHQQRDIDILQVCNLWFEERLYQTVYRARPRLIPRPSGPMPSLLMIGGSFSFYIAEYFRLYRMDHTIYRYYSTRHARSRKTAINRETLDWEQEVFSKSAVVIEVNVEVVPKVGFGFLEDAERVIRERQAQN
ncbi:MAG: alginate O-acetyltransferase AlgX-related protein [Myxococcota bacterium]